MVLVVALHLMVPLAMVAPLIVPPVSVTVPLLDKELAFNTCEIVSVPATVTAPKIGVATSKVAVLPTGTSTVLPTKGICAGDQLPALFQLASIAPVKVQSAENNAMVLKNSRKAARAT
jgi:hypothetical protein